MQKILRLIMRVAVVGGGYWGKNLIREFNDLGVLEAICEVDESLYPTYPPVKITKDFDDILINEHVTAVVIALPAEMHYRFAKKALEHKMDVFVEKPITLNVREADELINIASKMEKILMVGHLLHYHPCIERIKEIIKNGEIGKIENIVSNRLNLGKFRQTENVLWSFAPHDISVVLSLCGMPKSIQCSGKDFVRRGVHDITNTVMYCENDVYVNINVNWLNPFKEQKLTIIGQRGMLVFDDTLQEGKLKIYRDYMNCQRANKVNGEVVECSSEPPLMRECKHFVDCCTRRKSPLTDGTEGRDVLTVLNSLQKSLENKGERVTIGTLFQIHPSCYVDDGVEVGEGTRVWHGTHLVEGCKIGQNCNIGQNCYIAGELGDGCKVQNNVSVYKGVKCGKGVFLGPSCVFTNDKNPRALYPKGKYEATFVEDYATIGANATIVCGNIIGEGAFIGAGCVVTKDVNAYSLVTGNPARYIGFVDDVGNVTKMEKES